MSRIGKKPVAVPAGVTAAVDGKTVKVKGAKGELSFLAPDDVTVALESGGRRGRAARRARKRARAMWGMSRSQVANLVEGVTKGYEQQARDHRRRLQGRRRRQGAEAVARLQPRRRLSRSRPASPIATPKPTEILVSGIDKQKVGQTAAEIREFRGPEPYQGKGVRYSGEFIFRKEGKKK